MTRGDADAGIQVIRDFEIGVGEPKCLFKNDLAVFGREHLPGKLVAVDERSKKFSICFALSTWPNELDGIIKMKTPIKKLNSRDLIIENSEITFFISSRKAGVNDQE